MPSVRRIKSFGDNIIERGSIRTKTGIHSGLATNNINKKDMIDILESLVRTAKIRKSSIKFLLELKILITNRELMQNKPNLKGIPNVPYLPKTVYDSPPTSIMY
jgi:hypothetical protein